MNFPPVIAFLFSKTSFLTSSSCSLSSSHPTAFPSTCTSPPVILIPSPLITFTVSLAFPFSSPPLPSHHFPFQRLLSIPFFCTLPFGFTSFYSAISHELYLRRLHISLFSIFIYIATSPVHFFTSLAFTSPHPFLSLLLISLPLCLLFSPVLAFIASQSHLQSSSAFPSLPHPSSLPLVEFLLTTNLQLLDKLGDNLIYTQSPPEHSCHHVYQPNVYRNFGGKCTSSLTSTQSSLSTISRNVSRHYNIYM